MPVAVDELARQPVLPGLAGRGSDVVLRLVDPDRLDAPLAESETHPARTTVLIEHELVRTERQLVNQEFDVLVASLDVPVEKDLAVVVVEELVRPGLAGGPGCHDSIRRMTVP